ncbi:MULTISPECIES: hypothetical protein [unclassified Leifsonia]|uniref:hypothetical protein n=1 Tax=unclassified Leifsonia TaxID=2663824 RepID=UPI0006FB4EAF|nr:MULTISPECIES: hypothetical protein [unclassified Leifsonia]KQX05357.1 hypothetical protein ASC59_14505 [Leifsonia sp. Root1293]KRA08989.1 hypothetical protein ASD61_14500 [Leifsonia sp. Root60]
MSVSDVLAITVEVLSWIGLGIGIPLFLGVWIWRSGLWSWRRVDVEIVGPIGGGGPLSARWFAVDQVHERALAPSEAAGIPDLDAVKGFADQHGRLRFDRHSEASHVLWLLSLIFLAVGIVAFVVSVLLPFLTA